MSLVRGRRLRRSPTASMMPSRIRTSAREPSASRAPSEQLVGHAGGKLPTGTLDGREAGCVLLRRGRARRRRRRSAGGDRPPGQQRADLEVDHRLHRLCRRGRAARVRLVLDDRAPLPARGLRGHPERHPDLDLDRRPHQPHPSGHDVQRRAAVEPAATRRGLRDPAQPVRRPGHPRRRAGDRAAGGPPPQRQGRVDRLLRQPGEGGRRPAQPRGVRGVDGDHPPRPRQRVASRTPASTSGSRCRASPTEAAPSSR